MPIIFKNYQSGTPVEGDTYERQPDVGSTMSNCASSSEIHRVACHNVASYETIPSVISRLMPLGGRVPQVPGEPL